MNYYKNYVAAFVRGYAQLTNSFTIPRWLDEKALELLTHDDVETLINLGQWADLRLYRYKRKRVLPRVQKVIGILKGLYPSTVLDVGSGRGTFLYPLLEAFPELSVFIVETSVLRVQQLQALRLGGIDRLHVSHQDATRLGFADDSVDVVTALEVLEHIPDVQSAIFEVVRIASQFVIISVPSKPDNNPEHIHLFSQDDIRRMFGNAGITQTNFTYVHNHMIMVARVS